MRESSAARSKYFNASVTLPCWRRSCAIVATAMSHSGSTGKGYYCVNLENKKGRTDEGLLAELLGLCEVLLPLEES